MGIKEWIGIVHNIIMYLRIKKIDTIYIGYSWLGKLYVLWLKQNNCKVTITVTYKS